MRSLENYEIQAISGGLTSSQASYLVVMGVQAMVTLVLGATPQGIAIKHLVLPALAIAATAVAYEFHNQVVEPTLFKTADGSN